MKKLFLFFMLLTLTATSFAQSKVGTIDSDLIIASMDELNQVQKDMEAYGADLDKEFKTMVDKYQAKVSDYQTQEANLTDAVKKTKQEEIVGLEQDIQKFRQNSQGLIQIKQNELMEPLYTKVGQALDQVAKEQGYTQVFTLGNGVAYMDPKFDITEAVAKKMGVTLKK